MTHSNHRRGSRESLMEDYVLTLRGRSILRQPQKAREGVKILGAHNPIGIIKNRARADALPQRYMRDWKEGMGLKELVEDPDAPTYISAVYTSKKDVEGVVRDLAEADLGFSVVISGIFDEVFDICKKVGTGPHTVAMSMETIGRTELMPDNRILEIITMCGHSLVSQHYVKNLIDQVRKGKMTAYDAGLTLGKQCFCNYLNPIRAARIIEEYANTQR